MRLLTLLAVLSISAVVGANAVMGIGLEQFHPISWIVYVAVIVVLEAWLIGRIVDRPWYVALPISALANFITAILGNQCCGVGLHSTFVGTRENPNPFANFLVVLSVFTAISALIETLVWRFFVRDYPEGGLLREVFRAHGTGLLLGLVILLVPNRPYVFLEGYTNFARRLLVMSKLRKAFFDYAGTHGRLPSSRNAEEFVRKLTRPEDPANLWLVAYRASFDRFSMTETRREPFELNPRLSGMRVPEDEWPEDTWLFRMKNDAGCSGYRIEWQDSELKPEFDCAKLGL